ncbi:MAG: pentapeptide repeat-containing protein [Saprospiraceae bacterium]
MKETYYESKTFKSQDYSETKIRKKEFVDCTFIDCNFANCDFLGTQFIDCEFNSCNFSLAKFVETGLKNVHFIHSKLMGIDFQYCSDFLLAMSFDDCSLEFTNFYQKKLTNTTFRDCNIEKADFSEANLTGSSFLDCDLTNAVFDHSILTQVDFRTARYYQIDPSRNTIKKAKFSREGLAGLLYHLDIDID